MRSNHWTFCWIVACRSFELRPEYTAVLLLSQQLSRLNAAVAICAGAALTPTLNYSQPCFRRRRRALRHTNWHIHCTTAVGLFPTLYQDSKQGRLLSKASNVNRGWVKRLWVRKRNPAVRFACRLHWTQVLGSWGETSCSYMPNQVPELRSQSDGGTAQGAHVYQLGLSACMPAAERRARRTQPSTH